MRQLVTLILLVMLFSVGYAQVQEPLDNAALNQLRLSLYKNIQLQSGQTYQFGLNVIECCYVLKPVKAQVSWSIEPTVGAHIDSHTGLFSVDRSTPSGSIFTVTANVENGRRILSIKVYVYTPEANPLIGLWRERSQIKCGSNNLLTPRIPIEELEFRADDTFSVTWTPFEAYRDYWGSYSFDLQRGKIKFVAEGGNNVPSNIDGDGAFSIDDNRNLILKGVWLGSRSGETRYLRYSVLAALSIFHVRRCLTTHSTGAELACLLSSTWMLLGNTSRPVNSGVRCLPLCAGGRTRI